jgi:hypothetical protein
MLLTLSTLSSMYLPTDQRRSATAQLSTSTHRRHRAAGGGRSANTGGEPHHQPNAIPFCCPSSTVTLRYDCVTVVTFRNGVHALRCYVTGLLSIVAVTNVTSPEHWSVRVYVPTPSVLMDHLMLVLERHSNIDQVCPSFGTYAFRPGLVVPFVQCQPS